MKLFVFLGLVCAGVHAQTRLYSQINPSYSWVCITPTASQQAIMQADPSQNPVGMAGGCMPDALCNSSGMSPWTNVFG